MTMKERKGSFNTLEWGSLRNNETLDSGELCLKLWLHGSAHGDNVKPYLKAKFA